MCFKTNLFRILTKDDIRRRMRLPISYTNTEYLRAMSAKIMSKSRSIPAVEEDSILVPWTEINMWPWGKNRPYSEANLMKKFCGYPPEINGGKDEKCMSDYLLKTEHGGMQNPQLDTKRNLLPAGAPLIDFLRCIMERPDDWNLPDRAQDDSWSYERGITRRILDQVEVKEIVVGLSTED